MRVLILGIALFASTQVGYGEGLSDRQGHDPDMCYGSPWLRAEVMIMKYLNSAVPYCGELAKDLWNWTKQKHHCWCTRSPMFEIVYHRIQETWRTYYILCGHCRYYYSGSVSIEQQYAPCSYPETTAVCNDVIRDLHANIGECRSITEFWEIP
jgi:hypothetical protein